MVEQGEITDSVERITRGTRVCVRRDTMDGVDCLDVDSYARALANFLKGADELCFGLFGHWGRGKTHLAKRVADELHEQESHYCVHFSAWRYRTAPAIWANLYETIKVSLWKTDRLAFLRASVNQKGAVAFVLAVSAFGLSLFTVADRWAILLYVIRAIGLFGALWLAFVIFKSFSFGRDFLQLLSLPTYRDALGLQAAIGRDLDALLKGWLSKKSPFSLVTGILWAISIVFVAVMLFPGRPPSLPNPEPAIVVTNGVTGVATPDWLWEWLTPLLTASYRIWIVHLVIFGAWVIGAVVFSYAILPRVSQRRLLLIIDDLDRCQTDQMLDIVESLMLFLDSFETKPAVQIMVLLEETSLVCALGTRYKHLCDIPDSSVRQRVIRENVEKLFLAHLRLPKCTDSDIVSFFECLTPEYVNDDALNQGEHVPNRNREADAVSSRSAHDVAEVADSRKSSVADVTGTVGDIESDIEGIEIASDEETTLSIDEARAMFDNIERLSDQLCTDQWGPRTVRAMIAKYQLARAILDETTEDWDLNDLAKAICEVSAGLSGDTLEYRIAEQVCLFSDCPRAENDGGPSSCLGASSSRSRAHDLTNEATCPPVD